MLLNKVKDVTVVKPYALRITFADGAHGTHDFSEHVQSRGEILQPLRDPKYFASVFLDYGALTWPNGYDMCPDWLRMRMEEAGEITLPEAAE